MANLYDRPVQGEYFTLPYEELMRSGAMMQDQENKSRQATVDIGSKQYYSTAQDNEGLLKAKEDIHNKVEQLYQNHKGTGLRGATDDIHKLQRELQQREGQGGDLYAYHQSLEAQKGYMGDLDKMYEKGDISKDKRDRLLAISNDQYKGIGTPDNFGKYKVFNGVTAAQDVDLAKQADELAKGWKETKIHNEGWFENSSGGLYRKNGKTTEYIDPNEIYNNIMPQLKANPKNRAYADQEHLLNTYGQGQLIGPDEQGRQVEYNPYDPSAVAAHKENYVNDIFHKPAEYAANKYGFQSTSNESDIRNDEVAQHAAKKKIDDAMVRYSMQGIGINPQTVEKSAGQISNNIANLQESIKGLEADKSKLIPGSPESNTIDAQIAWNKVNLTKRQQLYDKAQVAVNGTQNAADKEMMAKYGEWNPEDFSDPNYLRIVNEMISKHVIPTQTMATTKNVMEYLGSKDPNVDARKLSSAYTRKNEAIDNYLKKTSDNYTIQPSLITVDNTTDQNTSKSIEDVYNNGMGSWQVFDENGPIPADKQPKKLQINQITEHPVDELGYLFSGTENVVGSDGKPTGEQHKYYVKPAGQHNINEKIGLDLVDENKPKSFDKAGNPQFEGNGKSRYEMGLNMIAPEYANQVSQIKTGYNQVILNGDKPVAHVSKEKTNHGIVYKVISPDGRDGSFGSEAEVLQVLRKLNP